MPSRSRWSGPGDLERARIVREQALVYALIRVDANEAWSVESTIEICPRLVELGVEPIQQPLHADKVEGYLRAARGVASDPTGVDEEAAIRCPTSAVLVV